MSGLSAGAARSSVGAIFKSAEASAPCAALRKKERRFIGGWLVAVNRLLPGRKLSSQRTLPELAVLRICRRGRAAKGGAQQAGSPWVGPFRTQLSGARCV
jgi:hypothetical protein